MAATIGAAATSAVIRVRMTDVQGEDVNKVFVLDGAVTDEDLEHLLDALDALSNAAITACTVSRVFNVTGLTPSATNALERNVSNQIVLTFEKESPINSAATVSRSFIIPAFVSAAQDPTTGAILRSEPALDPATAPEWMWDLIETLSAELQYEAADGDFYPGSWTYQPLKSSAVTVPNVIDGA